MRIFSPEFKPGEPIPTQYTCDGKDISIPLQWQDIPDGSISLALIMDDPDAPGGTWIHWIVFNIPVTTAAFTAGQPDSNDLPDGSLQGRNSWGKIGYGGPCPPSGSHRYFFKLYALDCLLEKKAGLTKTELLEAMQGHILAEAQFFGVYQRIH